MPGGDKIKSEGHEKIKRDSDRMKSVDPSQYIAIKDTTSDTMQSALDMIYTH